MENLIDLLFTEKDGLAEPKLETTNIESIRVLIERNKDRPNIACRELSYVYFMSRKDLYTGFTQEQRHEVLKERVGLSKNWKPDGAVTRALNEMMTDTVSREEKVLNLAEELLDDYIEVIIESRKNAQRIIQFMQRDINSVNAEEQQLRAEEIKVIREDINKFSAMLDNVNANINKVMDFRAQITQKEKETKRTVLSTLETNKDLYKREADEDDD